MVAQGQMDMVALVMRVAAEQKQSRSSHKSKSKAEAVTSKSKAEVATRAKAKPKQPQAKAKPKQPQAKRVALVLDLDAAKVAKLIQVRLKL